MKPNHFHRPVQSDRMLHDYGNTKLDKNDEFTLKTMFLGLGSMGLIAVAAMLIAAILPSAS
jgi:hypothetical protein